MWILDEDSADYADKMAEHRAELELHGFAITSPLLDTEEVDTLCRSLADVRTKEAVRIRRGVYAIRNLLHVSPEIAAFVRSRKIETLAKSALGTSAIAVRGTLFDKTAAANWSVPWHQDLTICVQERIEVTGFGAWTLKAGVHHVQPPVSFLENMVTIRIHLDDCDQDNGALRVLPGTHRMGRLSPEQIEQARALNQLVTCAVPRGGAVLMKPLLLHASSASRRPSHRRVIHIDFSSIKLPSGLRWFTDYFGGQKRTASRLPR